MASVSCGAGRALAELEQAERAAQGLLEAGGSDASAAFAAVAKAEALLLAAQMVAEEEDSPRLAKEFAAKTAAKRESVLRLRRRAGDLAREAALDRSRRAQEERTALLASSARDRAEAQANGGPLAGAKGSNARREMLDQASSIAKSRDITASLRRTTQMVSLELERMAAINDVLASDTQTIQSTSEEHNSLKTAAAKSEAVLKEIQRQERMDKYVTAACFGVFLLAVLYVIFRRTLAWFL